MGGRPGWVQLLFPLAEATPLTLPWPSNVEQFQLWSEVLLAWAAGNYAFSRRDPVGREELVELVRQGHHRWLRRVRYRGLGTAIVVALLPGLTAAHLGTRVILGSFAGLLTILLAWGRQRLALSPRLRGFSAEWEIAVNGLLIGLSGITISASDLTVASPVVLLPLAPARLTVVCSFLTAILLALPGGTHVIRGILDQAQTVPHLTPAPEGVPKGLDVPEYNRGRTIGNIERLLMLILIGAESYEALGLLVAAKGLIRAREFEDRDFAEYFIIGSLSSAAVALLVGVPLRLLVSSLW